MSAPSTPSAGRRYVAALVGWTGEALTGPMATAAAIGAFTSRLCRGIETDCSWGFELLLVVPVALVCLLGVAPWLVGWTVRNWIGPEAERPARRAARWSAAVAVVVLSLALGNGAEAVGRMVVAVLVGVPAVVAWATRPSATHAPRRRPIG